MIRRAAGHPPFTRPITLAEFQATGLTLEEIQGRSFLPIIEDRRHRGA